MKRSMVLVAALATAAGAAYLTGQLVTQAQAQAQPGAAGAPASPKVGLINMAYVLKGYNKFKSYNDEIEKIRLKYEKQENDLRKLVGDWEKFGASAKDQADRDKATDALKQCKRRIEDNAADYNKERSEKSDKQMVQMYKEVEEAVKRFAGSNGFHLIMHYSEPLTDADKMSVPNIQRKLVGPGGSGGVCPLYFVGGMDVSFDVVNTLNAMYPAPAGGAPVAAAPVGGKQ